jgi:hypothetical protein
MHSCAVSDSTMRMRTFAALQTEGSKTLRVEASSTTVVWLSSALSVAGCDSSECRLARKGRCRRPPGAVIARDPKKLKLWWEGGCPSDHKSAYVQTILDWGELEILCREITAPHPSHKMNRSLLGLQSAQRHDLYVAQPQCQRLAINNTFVFAVRQHPSFLTATSPDPGRISLVPFIRPSSAMSLSNSSAP